MLFYYVKILIFSDPTTTPILHKVMTLCFQSDPDLRPNFDNLSNFLNPLQPTELESLKKVN